MVDAALMSSTRTDWQTPEDVLERVRVIAPIGLDPCSTERNPTGAARFLTPADDGLDARHDWVELAGDGLIFANPPFGRGVQRWVERCASAGWRGRARVVLLVPARTDTRWFGAAWAAASAMCLWAGRMRFRGAPAPAPFPTALITMGVPYGDACKALGGCGLMVRP